MRVCKALDCVLGSYQITPFERHEAELRKELYVDPARTLSYSSHDCGHLLANAHFPRSRFFAGVPGEMSKSKMSMGNPRVVHAFGIC